MGVQFSEENQPTKRRGKGWRNLILDALDARGMSEGDLVKSLMERALDGEDMQSARLMSEMIARLAPIPKATSPLVTFEFPVKGTMVEKVDAIIDATSSGLLPSDIAQVIVGMLKTRMDVEETTELVHRMEKLEKLIADRGA